MSEFEKWFKTTEAYKMLEEQNYFKMDLFFFVGARNQYRHSGVQVAYLTWQHQQAIIDEHTEVIKLQDADLRKYEKQIESLKAQLNNMEACYIEKREECEELQGQLKTWKGQSLAAMLHGTCKCGEPWQSIISDREGFNLLHCFNCNNDRYENKEFFGDHEPKPLRGES